MTGWAWLLIAVGGGAGAAARYLVDSAVSGPARARPFPLGTLLINVCGSAVLGGLAATAGRHGLIYAGVGVGVCGGFTTFSTFTWETLALAEDGLPRLAAANVVLSLVLGIGAAALTYWAF